MHTTLSFVYFAGTSTSPNHFCGVESYASQVADRPNLQVKRVLRLRALLRCVTLRLRILSIYLSVCLSMA